MKVLLLSPYPEKLKNLIIESGDEVISHEHPIDESFITKNNIEFIVSYGYRYKLNSSLLKKVNYNAINLHLSYLPFNKGAYPNLWSHIDDTLSGVTIHLIDDDLDTGNILFQKEVKIDRNYHTFKSSYLFLTQEIERLFALNWIYIRKKICLGWPQTEQGTYHSIKDSETIIKTLKNGWETNINEFIMFNVNTKNQSSI